VSDLVFAYAICCDGLVSLQQSLEYLKTHQVLAKEIKALQSAHGLCRGVDIPEDNVRLAPHLHGFERDDIQNNAVCREQHVEVPLEVFFL
jgi:hypothetical protein